MKIKKVYFLIIILFFTHLNSGFAQTKIVGVVKNNTNKPLYSVSIVIKDSIKNNIFTYSYSNENGQYELIVNKLGNYNLYFSSLGYKNKIIPIKVIELKKIIEINVVLKEEPFELEEVVIYNERPISVKKDTINFKAKYFTDGTEQTIEDLIKKIPGIDIDKEGTIKVGNKEIERLMIDGDDFFEKGYKVLSKNMPAYPIEELEVLKNYSSNRLLKGIENSDRVALNLKLYDKSKRIWFGNINFSHGNDSFYEFNGNLMNFGKKNKFYFLTNTNNIGKDVTGNLDFLIRPFNLNEQSNIGDDQNVSSLINLESNSLNFKKNRTNFNNAKLISLNAIFNPSDKLKIKALVLFNRDETDFFRNSIELFYANGGNFINTEEYHLRSKNNVAFSKLDFIYNISTAKMIEATIKYKNGNFNKGSNLVFNTDPYIENLQHQNTLFDQKISFTNKLKDKKVLLLTGRFINEITPQNYTINQFFYKDLFTNLGNANNVLQKSLNQMQFAGINAHLLARRNNGNLLELKFGNKFRIDKLSTSFSILENDLVLDNPEGYQNQTIYQVNDIYLKSKYRLKIKNLDLLGKINFHQLLNKQENNGHLSIQNPFFINPGIGLEWKINDKNKIISSYNYNKTNAKVLDVYSDYVLTSFRTFSKGTGNFNQLNASSTYINYQLGNWGGRFFANTIILYRKNHDFFSTNSLVEKNYQQIEKILIKDREFLSVSSKLDYYLKFLSSNLKLELGYSKSEFKNIVNDSDLRQIKSGNYNYGLEFRSGFKGFFNYHIGTKWKTFEIETDINNSFTDNVSFLDLSFVFNDKFQTQLKSERYNFGNLRTTNTYYFLDFEMQYKLLMNKLTLGIIGKNLFNTDTFQNVSISDIGTSTTEYRLLSRFILFKLEYRF